MKIIEPSVKILDHIDGREMLQKIEKCARVCYKSERNITEKSAEKFIKNILKSGHESVIEHEKITVSIVCDRGVSHEIVRHRIASYSQESTRYCNYASEKFGRDLTFIKPCFWSEESDEYQVWREQMEYASLAYMRLLESGATPQEARSVLPNSLKTEIVVTMDLREWRHFLRLRTAGDAHPQMQEIAWMILGEFRKVIPVLFDDI